MRLLHFHSGVHRLNPHIVLRTKQEIGIFIAEQPAPAPHLAYQEACAALCIVLVTPCRTAHKQSVRSSAWIIRKPPMVSPNRRRQLQAEAPQFSWWCPSPQFPRRPAHKPYERGTPVCTPSAALLEPELERGRALLSRYVKSARSRRSSISSPL